MQNLKTFLFLINAVCIVGGVYFYYLFFYACWTGKTVGIRSIYEEIHRIENSLPERVMAKIIDEEIKADERKGRN